MSPKLERFNEGVGALSRKALDKKSDALKGQAHTAIDEGNFDELNHITDRLSALGKDAPADLNKIMDDFNNFLSRYGIEEEDFSLEEFILSLHVSPKTGEVRQIKQEETERKLKRNIQIRPAILSALIAKNDKGDFMYKSLREVSFAMSERYGISLEQINDDRDKAKFIVKKKVNLANEEHPGSTVKDVFEPWYTTKRRGGHTLNDFYKEVVRLYGSYDADRFVQEVIYRKEPEGTENKLVSQIQPVHEVVLCGAFGRDGVREQIQELLEWQPKQMDSLYKGIELSHNAAAKKRIKGGGNTSIDKNETRQAQKFIVEELTHEFTLNSEQYQNMQNIEGFNGIKTLYRITQQFNGDISRAQKLVHILFPSRQYTIDAQGYFISEKSSVGHLDSSSVNEGRGAI